MKKTISLLLCLLLLALCSYALADVAINETNFPDEIFRKFVSDNYDTDENESLSDSEIAQAQYMLVSNYGIASLKGIEYFTSLYGLDCRCNCLTTLDCGEISTLVELSCQFNQLTELNVSGNTHLAGLYCYDNQLTELDLSKNTELDQVLCANNQLTALDVSNNKALVMLLCGGNLLSELDVSNNTALGWLECPGNRLTALDVSKNTSLDSLYCDNNQLTALDVSRNLNLTNLWCHNNKLTGLDVSNNTKLNSLFCYNNRLKALDVSNAPTLCTYVQQNTRKTNADPVYDHWIENEYNSDLRIDQLVTLTAGDIVSDPTRLPRLVSSITLNKTKATLTRTASKSKPTLQLTAKVEPADADDPSVEWSSSNSKVAKVDENGKVTALKKGTAVITCTAKDGSGVSAKCTITVQDKLVTKITLNKTKLTLKKGKTFQLKVKTIKPANAFSKKVTWKSSNKKVATVDKNGKVTAKKKGTCTITCTAADGSKIKATCKITVK